MAETPRFDTDTRNAEDVSISMSEDFTPENPLASSTSSTALNQLVPSTSTTSSQELQIETKKSGRPQLFLGWDKEKVIYKRALSTLARLHSAALLSFGLVIFWVAMYSKFVGTKELDWRLATDKYENVPEDARISISTGVAIQNTYGGLFAYLLLLATVGFKETKFLIPYNVILSCFMFGVSFGNYITISGYKQMEPFFNPVCYLISAIQLLGTAAAFGYKVKDTKRVLLFAIVLIGGVLLFMSLIDFIGVGLYLKASELGKSIFRITLIPSITLLQLIVVRFLCRIIYDKVDYLRVDGGGAVSYMLAIIPVFVRAFYGRIFYLNVPDIGDLVWSAIVVEVCDIAIKLSHWNRRHLFRCIQVDKVLKKHDVLKPMMGQPTGDEFYALCLCFEKTVEILAIGFATMIQLMYQRYWGPGGDEYARAIYAALIQYAILSVGQLIALRLEYAFGIPALIKVVYHRQVPSKFRDSKDRLLVHLRIVLPILLVTTVCILTLCTWRGVFILHDYNWT